MKIPFGSMRHRYLTTISVFLVAVTLVSGMVGCDGSGGESYELTISSTSGGSVTVPGEGAFICSPGMVVGLVAEADEGYRFVNWSGDVGTIGNVTAAETTITMNDNYSITANFIVLYDLTIISPARGSVTTPGEGVFTYDGGTVVNLLAEPGAGYLFSSWTGDVGTITNINAATTTITMSGDYSITANFGWFDITQVSTFGWHMVGLKSDHLVLAVDWNPSGQCDTGNWADITQVAAGMEHTVGLESGGTVVAVGDNSLGQCDVGNWTDITQVAAGGYHTLGVKSDDTVVAVGTNGQGQCNVGNWTDIIQVAGGFLHTVGVKSDGTVVAVGADPTYPGGFSWHYGQCEVGNWTDITQVATYYYHTVGLKDDGTVVAVGNSTRGQCDVGNWTGITQVAAGYEHTVGLKDDGTVVAVGNNDYGQCDVGGWTDIIQIAAGYLDTVGLKSDGTVITAGPSYDV